MCIWLFIACVNLHRQTDWAMVSCALFSFFVKVLVFICCILDCALNAIERTQADAYGESFLLIASACLKFHIIRFGVYDKLCL